MLLGCRSQEFRVVGSSKNGSGLLYGCVSKSSYYGSSNAAAAPFEALIPASVADIWHVHERGFRMAIFNLGILGGIVSRKFSPRFLYIELI